MTIATNPTIATNTPTAPVAPTRHQLAARSASDDVKAFPAVLTSEWIKLSTLRANRAVLALTIITGGVVSWAVATLITDEVLVVSQVFTYSTVLTAVLAAITGILLFTSEAQHGTLAAALTAQPARWVIAVSKTITAAAVGVVLGATGLAAGVAGAVVGGLDMGDTSTMAATTMWALLFTSLAALFGLGVGMIVRHSAGAVSGLLVWWLVVENTFTLFMPAQIGRFLPFFAGNALLGIESDTATTESIAVALSRPENALVFAGYTAVALVVGTVLLYRRDTN
jgi:ABC-type transport system involved in multi-copper enzyme maturation permease subunit